MSKKLYCESMRKLMRIGLALAIACVALTAILCAGNASMVSWNNTLDGPFRLMPVLPYFTFVGGLLFAYAGFSFLNKRSDSDFYHSLPVTRTSLYLSKLLAALTYTVATVILSVLTSALVYLFMDVPFVAQYLWLGVPYFIVATMLVYASAAIACSITGTFFTNVILTGLVLFLPRFILFMAARSIVADTWIVGWRDLTGPLNPNTNIVTAMLVMQTRNMLKIDLVSAGNILYSLGLAVAELAVGLLLFDKRPSELAEQNAYNDKLQTLYACLLSLPVMVLIMRSPRKLTAAILLVASLIVYLAYQFAVLRKPKRVLRALPWYLCSVAFVAVLYFGAAGVGRAMLNDTPQASEIRSITFEGGDLDTPSRTYSAVAVSDVDLTQESVKAYVADSLLAASERVKQPYYAGERHFIDGAYNTVEPIAITLVNGRKLHRSIEFSDMNALNAARNENEQYCSAIRAFPSVSNIDFSIAAYGNEVAMSDEDAEKLRASFIAEYAEQGRVVSSYYDKQPLREPSLFRMNNLYIADEEQNVGGFSTIGHIGAKRFADWHDINLSTPKTAGLYMMLSNGVVSPDAVYTASTTLDILMKKLPESGYINVGCTFTNVPMQNGTRQQIGLYHNGNIYNGKYQSDDYYGASAENMKKLLDILARGVMTSDPSAMFAKLYFQTNIRFDGGMQHDAGTAYSAYLSFTKEDEKALLALIAEETRARYEQERIYNPDLESADVAIG